MDYTQKFPTLRRDQIIATLTMPVQVSARLSHREDDDDADVRAIQQIRNLHIERHLPDPDVRGWAKPLDRQGTITATFDFLHKDGYTTTYCAIFQCDNSNEPTLTYANKSEPLEEADYPVRRYILWRILSPYANIGTPSTWVTGKNRGEFAQDFMWQAQKDHEKSGKDTVLVNPHCPSTLHWINQLFRYELQTAQHCDISYNDWLIDILNKHSEDAALQQCLRRHAKEYCAFCGTKQGKSNE